MPHVSTIDQAHGLWLEWIAARTDRPDGPPLPMLRAILRHHGSFLAQHEVDAAFHHTAIGPPVFERFLDSLVALLGTPDLRLRQAFDYLTPDADGRVSTATLVAVAQAFAPDDPRCAQIAEQIDADGDSLITLSDLIAYRGERTPGGRRHYRATHVDPARIAATPRTSRPAPPPAGETAPKGPGVSSLQLRIGFFRLLQGAAYRSFRENYSANSETHLRARDLPYTMPDFAVFVRETVDYYLSLGIVEGQAAVAEFRTLVDLVDRAVGDLHARIAGWSRIPKSAPMLAAQAVIDHNRADLADHRTLFASVIEFILALRVEGIALSDLGPDMLVAHEINRLRHAELQTETFRADPGPALAQAGYLDSWNRVILNDRDEQVDGAIMPVAFWYTVFMPQLLRCASITCDADLAAIDAQTERDMDAWHAARTADGCFDTHSTDLRDGFASCTRQQKQGLMQAWALTEHYLNGLEKRREREEFGRDTGFLSEYVAFIDVFLGRSDVATSDMRLSFPYYIGPAVWCLLHASAECVEILPDRERADAIACFKRFFRAFATMYPCPYCRYHLNRFVIRNREVQFYPLEYLLLGRGADQDDLVISMDDKLQTVSLSAPGSLRLFLWKLHNAVSSSIARTEPWYHRDPRPLYTTRFWPSFDSELARAHALGQQAVPLDRIASIYGVVKPAAALAILRDELQLALHHGDTAGQGETVARADRIIVDLETAVLSSGLISSHYAFDPDKIDEAPHFTADEEAFARSGIFVER